MISRSVSLATSLAPRLRAALPLLRGGVRKFGEAGAVGRSAAFALAWIGLWTTHVDAQVPQPKINALTPLGLSRGSTNEVAVSGTELDEPEYLYFSDPRILSRPRPGGFTVIVPTNATPGVVEARWVGRFGVSTPRRLWIADNPELIVPPTNHSRGTALSMPAGAALNGRLEAGQVAWFRLPSPAAKGLTLHVAATALDSRVEPDLAVFDATGQELARNRRGGVITLATVPAGELLISLNDLRFRGGDGFGYRLTHGALAKIAQAALPNALPPLAAANPPPPIGREPLVVPPNTFLEFKPPAELRGTFPRRGQKTGATFTARKGQVFWLELLSERLGDVTDPLVLVQRLRPERGDHGEALYADVVDLPKLDGSPGGTEYPSNSRDVAGRFEAPEDATYRVSVRDQFAQSGQSPLHSWRLSVRPETRGVSLLVLPTPPPRQVDNDRQIHGSALNLRRGETVALKVLAYRRDGFNGDIDLLATNLPPGVTAATTRIAAGQRGGSVLLTASSNLSNGVAVITVLGRYTVETNSFSTSAQAGVALWSVPDWDLERPLVRLTDAVVVGRIGAEAAPLTVGPATNVFEVAAGGKITLPFQIERRGEFTAAFKLKAAGRPELDKAKELEVAEKGTNATVELNLAEAALPVGTHTIWWEGRAPGKYRNQPEAIDAAKAELKAAEEALAKAGAADKAAAEKRKQAATDSVKAAEERAKPRDVFAAVVSRPVILRVVPAK